VYLKLGGIRFIRAKFLPPRVFFAGGAPPSVFCEWGSTFQQMLKDRREEYYSNDSIPHF